MNLDPMNVDIVQLYQEEEYAFPYHYVARFKNDQFFHFMLDEWSINYASTMEYLLTKIEAEAGARIVDIGCGDGRFSRELSFAFPSSNVVGVDYSDKAIVLASAMNVGYTNLEFMAVDISDKHSLGVFDVAILMEVFEHIPVEKASIFMWQVRSLLKPGGVLYLTVPHENKTLEYKHFQHFSVKKIGGYLEPYFDIAQAQPFERISWLRPVLLKLLNNGLFILNNQRLLSMVYRFYKKYLFLCASERECQRIFVKAVAK